MRLINTKTLALEEFFADERELCYAILSHRWEEDELRFQDMLEGSPPATNKRGYWKMAAFCAQAAKDGYAYAWMDTCCINKESSAELSEAINSMFLWYKHAGVCYAYLFDVLLTENLLGESAWFTRGWTLQELLAPEAVVFLDRNWMWLGTKNSLQDLIQGVTGIDHTVLTGENGLWRCSVAERMHWASKRVTSRVEDMAYSLLGIFGINMPLLYGEKEKAFLRLQEEILRQTDDYTIFCWTGVKDAEPGLLAPSPAVFTNPWNYQNNEIIDASVPPYSMTNRGLSITLEMLPWVMDTYAVILPCHYSECPLLVYHGLPRGVCLFLRKTGREGQYARVKWRGRDLLEFAELVGYRVADEFITLMRNKAVYVRQSIAPMDHRDCFVEGDYGLAVPACFGLCQIGRPDAAHRDGTMMYYDLHPGNSGTVCLLNLSHAPTGFKWAQLGFDWNFDLVIYLIEGDWTPITADGAARTATPTGSSKSSLPTTSKHPGTVTYRNPNGNTFDLSCVSDPLWTKLEGTDELTPGVAERRLHKTLYGRKTSTILSHLEGPRIDYRTQVKWKTCLGESSRARYEFQLLLSGKVVQ